MSSACPNCRDLQQIALTASKAYHELQEDLEAAHICHNSEVLAYLSTRLEKALQSRNAAIAELTNHEATHPANEPAKSWRQSPNCRQFRSSEADPLNGISAPLSLSGSVRFWGRNAPA